MTSPTQDREHLRLLSIFHYVVAGLAALFSCIPLLHLFLGLAMVTGWGEFGPRDPEAALVGWFFIVVAGGLIVLGWGFAVALALAGRFLQQRRNHTFCLAMAGVACTFMPFGTVLGVFTIIVLVRESVKEMFENGDERAPGSAGPSA